MTPLDAIHLRPLMERTEGRAEIIIGLIDGPVASDCPALANDRIDLIPGSEISECVANSFACQHGTFVAGILSARRSSAAPAICPGCTLLVRPIFSETSIERKQIPSATPEQLAQAILDCVGAGARILNLSLALVERARRGESVLEQVLDDVARRGILLVAAAGNQGTVGGSIITRHPWIIPVTACDQMGRPLPQTNLGWSIGQHGLSAPGEAIISLGSDGKPLAMSGTSVAAPLVTGTIALLWSEFPTATAATVRLAMANAAVARRTSVVPPLLNAWSAYQLLKTQL